MDVQDIYILHLLFAGLGTVGVIGVAGAGGVTARVTSAPPKLTQVPDLTTPPQQAPSQPPHVS